MTIPNPWVQRLRGRDPEKYDAAREALSQTDRGREYLQHAGGNADFALYLQQADRKCIRFVGIGIFDIGDYLWHDAYDGGVPTGEAVREALENDDTYGAFMAQLGDE